MWFDSDLQSVWHEGFRPALEEVGYRPIRLDFFEHVNSVSDEILARIRSARLVVADFTGQRGGVYFEAGFAAGLGKPLIWTVREDELANLHFDVRQYNHIAWKDPKDLSIRLINRISALFPV
jgi:nucleoside 2-deoxyribosyltransferase